MKVIELKTTTETIVTGNRTVEMPITTGELIRTACNSNPDRTGFSATDMIDRIRILDFLEEAEKEKKELLELEDADYKNLATYVKSTKWAVVSKTIVDFVSQFEPETRTKTKTL